MSSFAPSTIDRQLIPCVSCGHSAREHFNKGLGSDEEDGPMSRQCLARHDPSDYDCQCPGYAPKSETVTEALGIKLVETEPMPYPHDCAHCGAPATAARSGSCRYCNTERPERIVCAFAPGKPVFA